MLAARSIRCICESGRQRFFRKKIVGSLPRGTGQFRTIPVTGRLVESGGRQKLSQPGQFRTIADNGRRDFSRRGQFRTRCEPLFSGRWQSEMRRSSWKNFRFTLAVYLSGTPPCKARNRAQPSQQSGRPRRERLRELDFVPRRAIRLRGLRQKRRSPGSATAP